MRAVFFFVVMAFGYSFAQDAVPSVPADPVFPYAENALVTLVVTTLLGIFSVVARKIPGKVGELVQYLIDLLSANVKHK